MVEGMDPTTPRIYTDEEQRQIKRKAHRIVWGVLAGVLVVFGGCTTMLVAGAETDPDEDRYERCAAAVAQQTPKSMWKHSDDVPGAVNDAVDRTRLATIGACMERLERDGY